MKDHDAYVLNTPVVLFFFIREDETMKVIDVLRKVKPPKIYLVGEGHRPDRDGEKERVLNLRKQVEMAIDWPCEIHKNYVPEDIGAGKRIASGISWVFEHEDKAIFLEDDIIPSISFFRYCETMLDHYEHDTRIMAISGNNPVPSFEMEGAYTFSSIPLIWGWATWKRAWQNYDFDMKKWPEMKKSGVLRPLFPNKLFYEFRCHEYDIAAKGINFTWDYQFSFHLLINSGLAIIPNVNMVENIGIGPNATNTKSKESKSMGIAHDIQFPIVFKENVLKDFAFDEYYFRNLLYVTYYTSLWARIKYRLKKLLPKKLVDVLRNKKK